MTASSILISIRILFMSSSKCPWKLFHISRDGHQSNSPGHWPQCVWTQLHTVAHPSIHAHTHEYHSVTWLFALSSF
jgi:hypothetical protein